MKASKRKMVRLKLPESLLEHLDEVSQPASLPKYEQDKIPLTYSFTKREAKEFIRDYKLMQKLLKECGYQFLTIYARGMGGFITRNKPRKRLKSKRLRLKKQRRRLR